MMLRQIRILVMTGAVLTTLLTERATASNFQPTILERGLQEIRAEYMALSDDQNLYDSSGGFMTQSGSILQSQKRKSPGKAFAMSLLVPGLGQYYYGSRVKPFLFFGAEVAIWGMYLNWHGDGNDLTSEFESFADSYWYESRYSDYLQGAYGFDDDDSISATEISHRLPDTKTQQYYEMIGKYDQFSWGWVDAYLNDPGDTLGGFDPPRVTGTGTTPHSSLRDDYEIMRYDANKKFDKANKMIAVSIVNRLISAFEAYFSTRRINSGLRESGDEFGRVRVRARLKSYTSQYDTPFLNVSYRF